jgi:hypothetical protein
MNDRQLIGWMVVTLLALCVGIGVGWVTGLAKGAFLRRRRLTGAYDDGYDDGVTDGRKVLHVVAEPPTQAMPAVSGWREQTAHDLAPAALEAEAKELPLGGTLRDGMSGQPLLQEPAGGASPLDALPVPPLTDGRPRPEERQAGPSPYTGNLTPAQRRRDKHKQRGEYAPAELGHWYADQLHYIADWQAEWHAESAWFEREWLPGYLGWYRDGLEPGVGLRRILETA